MSHNPAGMSDCVYCGFWARSATNATDTPDFDNFDWPGYSYWQPAVGYPVHSVFLYKKDEL